MAFDVKVRGKSFQVCRINPQTFGRLRQAVETFRDASFADDGMYHGNNPPNGWIQVGTGPKGGKIWGPPGTKKSGAAKPAPKRPMADEEEQKKIESEKPPENKETTKEIEKGYAAFDKNEINSIEDAGKYLGTKDVGKAALAAFASGAFTEINENPNHPVSKALKEYISKLPDTKVEKMHRVLGFVNDADRDAFLKSVGSVGEVSKQSRTLTSWTKKDPNAAGQTPMNNIALDLAESFGPSKVFLTSESPNGAKDVSFAYGENLSGTGTEYLLQDGNQQQVKQVTRDAKGVHVVLGPVDDSPKPAAVKPEQKKSEAKSPSKQEAARQEIDSRISQFDPNSRMYKLWQRSMQRRAKGAEKRKAAAELAKRTEEKKFRDIDVNIQNLRSIVANHKKPVPVTIGFSDEQRQPTLLPPVGLGHLKDLQSVFLPSDKPNVGEVVNLWLDGNVIKGDLLRVPKEICDLIENGSYSKVSVELWPWPPGKFKGEGWMLKRVALLGADVPAVYSLDTIPVPDSKAGVIRGVELFEVGTHNKKTYTLDDLKDIVNNYWLNRPDNESIAASMRRYLKRDAERPLSDGAAAKEHADREETVCVFRDLGSTYAVDQTRGASMNPADIRAALVSAGVLTQEDADGIADAVIIKFAPLIQPKANADETTTDKPAPPPKEAANADDPTPPVKKEGEEKPMNFKDVEALIQSSVATALRGRDKKIDDLQKTNATTKARAEAVAFCDSLKSKQVLTHGMNKDGLLVDILTEADLVPGEFTFSDQTGKAAKGTFGAKLREFLSRIPKFSDYKEIHGGAPGDKPKTAKEKEEHETSVLNAAFAGFSDDWKRHFKNEENFALGFKARRKNLEPDLTVEDYVAQLK